ncbi:NAD-dependent succinate-semialdehyde dehydrogenase [Aliirhizobium cellulosilyticum]|uniref:Succinate-semialdehyde dehydrogenase/glutarate-semialdehyde dehydrogenase n=1 Tax=Aliirhizobium cellulosilyticum TaxID=393664 RepID=A0A7W6V0Q7_9HYPH|nr:NAD-dependent succinate-semialdehyde dehydrogenase [Rhizobium cellulosilyticum]MBB4349394.1 succinate-semialdehyde dehydrogenase/glutarate-semialdehyde dehydrogenase [Rhizobium cellulosilyticum]MBB4412384.1 succinate-semialdehyde dehydrogenase/glutarate-semialdehyde dehydrogenase [Rhizobium cellulosilyticum]MBB4447016.1 succinate-semialdehyde dehydrogenase/glutarate-semialdehyde dehydrogenase [Rhizobium cellulosilyticum]
MTADGYDDLKLYIHGEWVAGADGTSPVHNPATYEQIGLVPLASKEQVDKALQSAAEAYRTWSRMSPLARGAILKKAAQLIRERADHIKRQLTMEEGKPLHESHYEVYTSADYFDWFAEEGKRAYGRTIPGRNAGSRQTVNREPIGPVAAFAPWNFPAITPTRKIAASLAAGCVCIIKPAEECPSTALAIVRALHDAGLPKGVVNVLFGNPAEISEKLISSPHIRKISFTGSLPVGRLLGRLAADEIKPITLELGGHAPVLVFDDADVDAIIDLSVRSKYRNAGQVCLAPTRFLIQEGIYDKFVSAFVDRTKALNIGNGLNPETDVGPMANQRRLSATSELVEDAISKGAKIRTGGPSERNAGYYWNPTVITDLSPDARLMNEEPFSPIAMLAPFGSMEDALVEANRLPYGLAAYVFTRSHKTAYEVTSNVEVAMFGVNQYSITVAETPFGGIKESGFGSEGGIEGLQGYMVNKYTSEAFM